MKNQIKHALNVATTYGVLTLSIVVAKAAWTTDSDQPDGVMGSNFRANVVDIMNYILGFLGLIAVGFIVYAGLLMVTAGGDDDAIGNGKKIITWAAIGIVIILLSYGIVNVVIGAGGQTT